MTMDLLTAGRTPTLKQITSLYFKVMNMELAQLTNRHRLMRDSLDDNKIAF